MNGCDYFFVAGAFDEKSNTEGWIDIVCPGAAQITAEVFLGMTKVCTITVPAQNELKKVTYTNKADIEGNFTLLADVGVEGFCLYPGPWHGHVQMPGKKCQKRRLLHAIHNQGTQSRNQHSGGHLDRMTGPD
jgi:hypothetical protein